MHKKSGHKLDKAVKAAQKMGVLDTDNPQATFLKDLQGDEPGKTTLVQFEHPMGTAGVPDYQIGDIYKVQNIVLGIVRDVQVECDVKKIIRCKYTIAMTPEAPKCLVAENSYALQFCDEKKPGMHEYNLGDTYETSPGGHPVGVIIGKDVQSSHIYYAVACLPGMVGKKLPGAMQTGGSAHLLQQKLKAMDVVGVHVPLPPGIARARNDAYADFTDRPKRRIVRKKKKKPSPED